MVAVVAIIYGCWLGAILRLEYTGVEYWALDSRVLIALALPTLVLPIFGPGSRTAHALSEGRNAIFLTIAFSVVGFAAILSWIIGLVSTTTAILLASHIYQLLVVSAFYRSFWRRHERAPIDVRPPGFAAYILPYALDATRKPIADVRYVVGIYVATVWPFFAAVISA